ncbi:MAG TPA: DUF559 domain-containing protein [Actinomycetota bacterium]|nr:DUF559 domain-containing protein [Actinomycetota bacterium]
MIAALAADRFGVFARADALARGVTSNEIQHRLATRRLTAVHKGVYRISGSPDLWHQRLMAAFLALRSRGVVSHRSAARLQGIVGAAEDPLEFIVPASVDRGRSGLILHTTGALSSQDITTIGPFRVTHPARTLFDLAAVCDADVVEEAVDDALARRLVTPARIRWELGQLRARRPPGVGVMRRLLEARETGGSESKLETRLLRIIRRAGLPIPVQQYRIWCGRRIVARVDLAYPNERIAIEADGRGIHARPRTWARDIEKMNSLARVGWRFVRFTWTDVHQKPEEIAGTIRDLLGA